MTAVQEDDTATSAFEAAMAKDAGQPATPPDLPAPPRLPERDPDAPFGRDDEGKPVAPHGFKANGVPRQKPGGRGRAPAEAKPMVTTVTQAATTGAKSYTDDLIDAGMSVWLAGSMVRGGRLLGVRVPDLRPYAAHWQAQLPQLAGAWNVAAQQNATVRGYVEKLSANGSATWMIGVGLTTVGFFMGCAEIAKADQDTRTELATSNDAALKQYFESLVKASGLQQGAA